MASAGFLPGVEIETRFQRATSSDVPILSAYIYGPVGKLIRYAKSDEKLNGLLGGYDEDGSVSEPYWTYYDYPRRLAGEIVDLSFSKLFVDNGFLQYWNIAAGTMTAVDRNTIRHSGLIFAAGNGFSHSGAFLDRGVKVGDPVLIKGNRPGPTPFTLATYVAGFNAEMSSAALSAAVAGAANTGALTAAATVTNGGANSGNITVTANGANYDGRPSGFMQEVYTVTVLQGSTGGDATTARLKVTSASGKDDQLLVTPAAFGTLFNIGNRGARISIALAGAATNIAAGDVFTISITQVYTVPTVTIGGSYAASDTLDRVYSVTITRGAAHNGSPVVRVTELRGLDVDVTYTLAAAVAANTTVAVALGSYGPTLTFVASSGLVTGNSWTVTATASKPQQNRSLKLAHSLPADIVLADATAAALDVTLYIKGNYEIPKKSTVAGQFNYRSEALQFSVASGINLFDSSWTNSGAQVALPLKNPTQFTDASRLYLQARYWVARQSAIGSFQKTSELATLIQGPTDPDNPLKYALSKAGLGSGGRTIYYFNVGDPTVLANWQTALKMAEKKRDAYGLVPLSIDPAVIDASAAFVTSQAAPTVNQDKALWIVAPELTSAVVVSAANTTNSAVALATITDDASRTGLQYTYVTVTSANIDLIAKGVRAGDTLRVNYGTDAWGDVSYESYVIDSVVNETVLRLVSGPISAIAVATKIEIHRTLLPADFISAIKTSVGPFTLGSDGTALSGGSARYFGFVNRYLPFGVVYDGVTEVPAYHMAAVLAGIRSNLAPHQSMTRYPVPGFNGIKNIEKYSVAELNELAAAGCFIVAPDAQTAAIRVRHGVTCGDFNDVNTREESIISNVHSIKFTLFDVLDPYIGQANVTDETIAMIESEIRSAGQLLRSANAGRALGGQISALRIINLRPSPILKDTILIDVEVIVPAPVNRIRLTLFVQ